MRFSEITSKKQLKDLTENCQICGGKVKKLQNFGVKMICAANKEHFAAYYNTGHEDDLVFDGYLWVLESSNLLLLTNPAEGYTKVFRDGVELALMPFIIEYSVNLVDVVQNYLIMK